MRRTSRAVSFALLLTLASAGPVTGPRAGAKENDDSDRKAALEKRKREAIRRGIEWLKKQQKPDGSFDYDDAPFRIGGMEHMIQGSTGLACFTLLKSGVAPNDPAIGKSFGAMLNLPVKHCYSAGCVLLAIDAYVNWQPPEEDDDEAAPGETEGPGTREKKGQAQGGGAGAAKKPKRDPRLIELARQCVAFLEKNQQKSLWRYPYGTTEDVSVAQYALLGLDAGERIGVPVSKACYEKALEYFLREQEPNGPEVKAFLVPGAEHSFKELRQIEKELRDKIHKIDAAFRGKKRGDVDANGRTEEDQRRLAEEEASKRIYRTGEKDTATREKMYARGWKYMTEGRRWQSTPTGSMTASGMACTLICKAHLDAAPAYEKIRKQVDKAVRDGAAWLAKNFSVKENPAHQMHHYYYMYSLERAGILGLVPKFGERDWYDDGVKMFLGVQHKNGSWDAGDTGTSGAMCDTCFALLFICRGTTPVVRIPERVVTGKNAGASN